MKSAGNFIRKRKNFLKDKRMSQIRYNLEMAELGEDHFEDPKLIYSFFIIHRNPELILNKILEQFSKGDFHPVLEPLPKMKGKVSGTVNEYVFANYYSDKKLENLSFEFTSIPYFKDGNLTNKYRKKDGLLKYLSQFIDE
jgi:hypothetical protein